jgi:hypothetical protein
MRGSQLAGHFAATLEELMTKPDEQWETRLTPEERKRLERHFEEMYFSDSGEDLTPEEARHFKERFEALGREFDKEAEFFHGMVEKHVQQLAGEHLNAMMRSPKDAENYLQSSEPSLRQAALHVLYNRWGQGEAYADRYERMAMSDTNDDVRMRSFQLLGRCYSYTRNRRISSIVAKVVLDRNEADQVRRSAYHALLNLHGRLAIRTVFQKFPADADWAFVESCSLGQEKQEKTAMGELGREQET